MGQVPVALTPRLPQPVSSQGFITPAQWQLATDVIWPSAADPAMVATAWSYCIARGLDPMKRPVHIVPVWSKAARKKIEGIWPSITEVQITASRTGSWAGMDLPQWGPDQQRTFKGVEDDNGSAKPVEVTLTFPEWCAVVVWRIVGNERRAFSEPVYWLEAYAKVGFRSELPNAMWMQRPRGQLHKVAKAAALRAAFPEEGELTSDEMQGQVVDHGPTIDHDPPPPPRNGAAAPRNRKSAPQPEQQPEQEPARDFPIRLLTGAEHVVHSSADFLGFWQDGIAQMIESPDKIRRAREVNQDTLQQVAAFDQDSVVKVNAMLDEALRE